jgi:hypothetical protein
MFAGVMMLVGKLHHARNGRLHPPFRWPARAKNPAILRVLQEPRIEMLI